MEFYTERAKYIASLFPESILISDYLVKDPFWNKAVDYSPDFILNYRGVPFCPIEIINYSDINDFNLLSNRFHLIGYSQPNEYPYAIIDLVKNCYLLSEADGYKLHEPIPFEEAASIITARMRTITSTDVASLDNDFLEKLYFFAKNTDGLTDEVIKSLGRFTIADLDWANIKRSPTVITLSQKFEQKLFMAVLGKYTYPKVCRYTSRSALSRIISTQKQSLCSIVGMNDKSECYYTDSYFSNKRGYNKGKHQNPSFLNKYFISSCSRMDTDVKDGSMADNLTMWRMYADEGQGVCLVFDVDTEIMENGYVLAPISYGQIRPITEIDGMGENGEPTYAYVGTEHFHPELDLIFSIMNSMVGGYEFRFPHFDFWKHFFKSFEYRDEKEIRLMYYAQDADKNKWIEGNNIFCPIIEKSVKNGMNQYPLVLQQVILGPRFAEKEINVFQIQQMIEESDIENGVNVECTKSEIDNYR